MRTFRRGGRASNLIACLTLVDAIAPLIDGAEAQAARGGGGGKGSVAAMLDALALSSAAGSAEVGLGRIVALYHSSSTSYRTC